MQFYMELLVFISLAHAHPSVWLTRPLTPPLVKSSTGHVCSASHVLLILPVTAVNLSIPPSLFILSLHIIECAILVEIISTQMGRYKRQEGMKKKWAKWNEPRAEAKLKCLARWSAVSHCFWLSVTRVRDAHLNLIAWGCHTALAGAYLTPWVIEIGVRYHGVCTQISGPRTESFSFPLGSSAVHYAVRFSQMFEIFVRFNII